jgi:cardiolipin synthase
LLPAPQHQDHPTVTFIQRRLYPKLEKSGVSAYEYLPSMMHAKTMLIDDRLSVVGSMNLDFLSMEWLEEGCLMVDDVPFAKAFEQRWLVDMARSRQVTARRPAGEAEQLREDAAGVRTAQSSVSP